MRPERAIAPISATLVIAISMLSLSAWAAPASDACSLLTAAQVQAALGVPVSPGKAPVPKSCQWKQEAKPGAEVVNTDLNLWDIHQFNLQKTSAALVQATITPVTGLGDEAYYRSKTTPHSQSELLFVKKGDAAFSIRIWGKKIPADDLRAKEKTLAEDVLARF